MNVLSTIMDRLQGMLADPRALELVVLAAIALFTIVAWHARRRRRRKARATRRRQRPTRASDHGGVTSSQQNDLFNEAFGDDFSDTGSNDNGEGGDGD